VVKVNSHLLLTERILPEIKKGESEKNKEVPMDDPYFYSSCFSTTAKPAKLYYHIDKPGNDSDLSILISILSFSVNDVKESFVKLCAFLKITGLFY